MPILEPSTTPFLALTLSAFSSVILPSLAQSKRKSQSISRSLSLLIKYDSGKLTTVPHLFLKIFNSSMSIPERFTAPPFESLTAIISAPYSLVILSAVAMPTFPNPSRTIFAPFNGKFIFSANNLVA